MTVVDRRNSLLADKHKQLRAVQRGADGLVKNPRDKVSIVFKGQDEIMHPNTEGARRGGLVNK